MRSAGYRSIRLQTECRSRCPLAAAQPAFPLPRNLGGLTRSQGAGLRREEAGHGGQLGGGALTLKFNIDFTDVIVLK